MKIRELFNNDVQFDDNEWNSIENLLIERSFKKGEYLVSEGEVENYVNLIIEGVCRVYYVKKGIEYTYVFALEHEWISSYESFNSIMPSDEYIQAVTNMKVYSIHRDNLKNLFSLNSKFSILERYVVNQIINDKTKRLRSFVIDSPDERYLELLKKKSNLVQKIPLKYLATYIGITAESLSRLRKRLVQK